MIANSNKGNAPAPAAGTAPSFQPSAKTAPQERQNLFKKSMERQADKLENSEEQRAGDSKGADKKGVIQRQGESLKDDQEGSGERGDAALAARSLASGKASGKVQQAQSSDAALPAHIEKMAAAIQELASRGLNAQFQLQLPLGQMSVDSVILARDAAGRIAIQLQGQGQLPTAAMNRIAADLAQRLRQKKLRVSSVEFSSPASPFQVRGGKQG